MDVSVPVPAKDLQYLSPRPDFMHVHHVKIFFHVLMSEKTNTQMPNKIQACRVIC